MSFKEGARVNPQNIDHLPKAVQETIMNAYSLTEDVEDQLSSVRFAKGTGDIGAVEDTGEYFDVIVGEMVFNLLKGKLNASEVSPDGAYIQNSELNKQLKAEVIAWLKERRKQLKAAGSAHTLQTTSEIEFIADELATSIVETVRFQTQVITLLKELRWSDVESWLLKRIEERRQTRVANPVRSARIQLPQSEEELV